jgi:hypothetical protein
MSVKTNFAMLSILSFAKNLLPKTEDASVGLYFLSGFVPLFTNTAYQ